MPLFDFECLDCETEVKDKLAKCEEVVHCPKCGERMKKKVCCGNFHLSGTGWARDNYGLKGARK